MYISMQEKYYFYLRKIMILYKKSEKNDFEKNLSIIYFSKSIKIAFKIFFHNVRNKEIIKCPVSSETCYTCLPISIAAIDTSNVCN